MNNQPCIILHCISLQRDNEPKLILDYLNDFVKKNWPMTHVFLESTQPYWKDETREDSTYGIYGNTRIMVKDFIDKIKITWLYSQSKVHDVNSKISYQNESAIWSKNTHPDENFFSTSITWVHIYTWYE